MTQEILVIEDTELLIEYVTQQDILDLTQPPVLLEAAVQGPPGYGVPHGGTTGQLLAKRSNVDGDEQWVDPPNSAVWGLITGTVTDQADLVAFVEDQIATSASRSVSFAFAAAHG